MHIGKKKRGEQQDAAPRVWFLVSVLRVGTNEATHVAGVAPAFPALIISCAISSLSNPEEPSRAPCLVISSAPRMRPVINCPSMPVGRDGSVSCASTCGNYNKILRGGDRINVSEREAKDGMG